MGHLRQHSISTDPPSPATPKPGSTAPLGIATAPNMWSVRDRSTSQCYDVGSYTFWHQRATLEVTWGGFMLSLLPFRQSFIIPRSFDVRTGFIAAPTPPIFA
ncbi:hypothetical protein DFH09DRAFT_1336956 [Mycena vulgaris]|nr:hypothetical protein DFH09DRAFT_1336956 [Mycena vulgaris]